MSFVSDACEKGAFTFVWRIDNFSHCTTANRTAIHSTWFFVKTLVTTFRLDLYPRGIDDPNYMVCCLFRSDSSGISVDCELCICTLSGERLDVNKKENIIFPWDERTSREVARFERKVTADPLLQDKFVLHCHLRNCNSNRTETPTHCYAGTRFVLRRKLFAWNIEKFSSILLKEEKVFSLASVSQEHPTLTFKLSLAGTTVDDASVQIVVHFAGVKDRTFSTCKMTVVDVSGASAKFMRDEYWLEDGDDRVEMRVFPPFLTRRELMAERHSYLPDDVLSLRCEVTLSGGQGYIVQGGIEQVAYGQSTHAAIDFFLEQSRACPQVTGGVFPNALLGDLRSLYEAGALCDFELYVGGRAFPVHRLILSARSPVFRAMFENDMLEKSNGSLALSDLDAETVDRMLRYVYTDAVPDAGLHETALLYFAADKYQLTALRQRCSALLGERLDKTNAAEVLALADRHHDQGLKRWVQGFVFNRGRAVLDTDEWKRLEREDPALVLETLRHVFCEMVDAPPTQVPS